MTTETQTRFDLAGKVESLLSTNQICDLLRALHSTAARETKLKLQDVLVAIAEDVRATRLASTSSPADRIT